MEKQVLSEFYGDNENKAQVKIIPTTRASTTWSGQVWPDGTMFEVLWNGKSVGCYNTEQEAENVAENYALGSSVSRT